MIVRLAVLCVVELLVVVLLALQLLAAPAAPTTPPPRGEATTPAAAPSPAPLVPATGDASATPVSGASAPDTAPQHRQEVAAKWIADDPVGVLLTGAIRFSDGTRVTQANIWAERDKKRLSGDGADGTYAIAGLSPGEWTVHIGGSDSADRQEALTLTDDAVQQRDFVLDRSFAIKVHIVTATGEDATTALRKARIQSDFAVAGQRDRFPERFAPTDYGMVFVGDAKWDSEMNPKDGFAGTLRLAQPPPAHVALLQRHLLLEQQVVQPGQGEIRFVVDLDKLKALAGSATVRVVDADTGQPIAGARLSVNTSNRHGQGSVTDADGRATAQNLSPGLLRCEIFAKDHEQMYTTVRVESGMQLDLGEVRVGPALPLTGRVVDAAGKPVGGAQLIWAELKWLGDVLPFATNRVAESDAEGAFTLFGTGRGAIAVTASTQDGLKARAVFDNPPAEPVVLRLDTTGECVVTRPDDPTRFFIIVWFDAQRRPVGASTLENRWREPRLKLPIGEQTFEVRENGRVLQTGTVQIGATPARLEIR